MSDDESMRASIINSYTEARCIYARPLNKENELEMYRLRWEYIFNQLVSEYNHRFSMEVIKVVIKRAFIEYHCGIQEHNTDIHLYVGQTLPFILD